MIPTTECRSVHNSWKAENVMTTADPPQGKIHGPTTTDIEQGVSAADAADTQVHIVLLIASAVLGGFLLGALAVALAVQARKQLSKGNYAAAVTWARRSRITCYISIAGGLVMALAALLGSS